MFPVGSRVKQKNKDGKQIASRPFSALCGLFDNNLFHLHVQIPA